MRVLVSFLFSTVILSAFGQVEIESSPAIEALVRKQGEVVPPDINPMIQGYRVQIFFDVDRDLINEKRAQFFARYSDIDAYTTYNAPNFFLRVGDFRTKLEAKKLHAELLEFFPTAFIVQEKINLPRLEKRDDD